MSLKVGKIIFSNFFLFLLFLFLKLLSQNVFITSYSDQYVHQFFLQKRCLKVSSTVYSPEIRRWKKLSQRRKHLLLFSLLLIFTCLLFFFIFTFIFFHFSPVFFLYTLSLVSICLRCCSVDYQYHCYCRSLLLLLMIIYVHTYVQQI